MFTITICDKWCAVVPHSWINAEKKLLMWPSHGINVSNAIKKSLPPQTSWKSFSYKYLIGPFGKNIYIYIYIYI